MDKCPKCQGKEIKLRESYKFHDIYECLKCQYWTFKRIKDCCRNPNTVVVKSGNTFLYRQCIDCGCSVERNKPLNHSVWGNECKGAFSDESFTNWKGEFKEEANSLAEAKKITNYLYSSRYKYDVYISSPEWREKRKLVMERENYQCQRCLSKAEEVHHSEGYDNLGKESLDELEALCRNCHAKEHHKL